jgi:DNA-binding MarR family transcriptional regulator
LPSGEQAILRALIQFPDGLRREQLTVLTGYKTSTRNAYIARLTQKGFVQTNLTYVYATDAGRAAMPNAEPLPTGEALREFWYRELPDGECSVLKQLVELYPDKVEREVVTDLTGYKTSTRNAYLARLRAKQLVVVVDREHVKASETLFEVDA